VAGYAGFYHVDPMRLGPLGRALLGDDDVGPTPGAIPFLTPDTGYAWLVAGYPPPAWWVRREALREAQRREDDE